MVSSVEFAAPLPHGKPSPFREAGEEGFPGPDGAGGSPRMRRSRVRRRQC